MKFEIEYAQFTKIKISGRIGGKGVEMEVRIVLDGMAYEFESYSDLRELLDEKAQNVTEANEDDGVYFP